MWRFLRNRRLILRLHTVFRAIILGASRGHLCDSVASCLDLVYETRRKIPTQEEYPIHHSLSHIVFINYNKTHKSQL